MPIEKDGRNWIQSRSGLKVDLLDPNPDAINIEDIAHALSQLCRYTGHTQRPYSVAEHSVRVSYRAEDLARDGEDGSPGCLQRIARWGLLHDATEAYLGDVSRPLKYLPDMAGYKRIEKIWMKVIAAKFGLVGEQPPEVDQADDEMLGTEAHALMQPVHPEWGMTCPTGKLPDPLPEVGWIGWHHSIAKDRFLMRFKDLFPEFK